MKVAVIGTVGLPARYGGFETLVENLVKNISDDNLPYDVSVYCSGKIYPDRQNTYMSAKLIYLPFNANGPQSVIYDYFSLLSAMWRADIILLLGVSGATILPLVRALSSVKIITNIDGLEWQREKWRGVSKWFLKISEAFAVRFSHNVVADNSAIADYVRNKYDVVPSFIAYGGDHASLRPSKSITPHDLDLDFPYAFALCRIEPENNVHLILEAFSQCQTRLIFIGNWQASEYGQDLHKRYCSNSNLRLLDPVYDAELLWVYRNSCFVYIHGHSAGGTNPSLVEMMHFAKPVIAFDCIYNRATMENKGSYFENSSELIQQVESLENAPDLDMQEIAKRRYTWKLVTQQYVSLLK